MLMTDLERYRRDIATNDLRLEVFCDDLLDNFETAEKAMKWLENHFVPAFELSVEEHYPQGGKDENC